MSRFYLSYRLELEEPLILGDGSQIGNVLQTHDHIPGSTLLGVCAGLYLKEKRAYEASGRYTQEFRDLFLSDKTIFSPAYPLASGAHKCFPMPLSVLGCKYHGINTEEARHREMHKFADYLYGDIPDRCEKPGCNAPLEHKKGFVFHHRDHGYCNVDVTRQIVSHNQVAELEDDKRLFSFESLAEGQQFWGEVSFSCEEQRDLLLAALEKNDLARLGKARNRGYGQVRFVSVVPSDGSFRESLNRGRSTGTNSPASSSSPFAITFFSDAIVVDRALNHRTAIDHEILAFWLGLDTSSDLSVQLEPGQMGRSFYGSSKVLGFNQHRRMPLSVEATIVRGSVFTCRYTGNQCIHDKLKELQGNGLGLRRNEGFGMVVIDHKIHGAPREVKP